MTPPRGRHKRGRGESYMASVVAGLESTSLDGRNAALNGTAWTLGRWIAAGALEQANVEDELYAAAVRNRLIADDGERQCWATIRSGLSAGLQEPIDLGDDRTRASDAVPSDLSTSSSCVDRRTAATTEKVVG